MATKNITLSVDEALLKQVKVLAAQRETSVSALVADVMRHLVGDPDDYDTVWQEEARVMSSGLLEVGPRTWSREDLHART